MIPLGGVMRHELTDGTPQRRLEKLLAADYLRMPSKES
jgi:hypothetical protein